MLLAELGVIDEEIGWLERKINELKLDFYQEKRQIKEWELLQLKGGMQPQWEQQRQMKKFPSRRPQDDCEALSKSQNYENRRYRRSNGRRASLGSQIELQNATSSGTNGKN